MHSRIFEIVKVESNANYEPQMTEAGFYDYIPGLFDYVNEDTDLASDIDWLVDRTNDLIIDGDIIDLTDKHRRTYFEKRFDELKRTVETMTLDDFARNTYHIETLVREEYGFYIYIDGRLEPMDDFIRYCKDGKYKIVSSMDYHY